jgi:hypothetical protein
LFDALIDPRVELGPVAFENNAVRWSGLIPFRSLGGEWLSGQKTNFHRPEDAPAIVPIDFLSANWIKRAKAAEHFFRGSAL